MDIPFISSKPKLGVALSGGGVKGLAHIGALKSLLSHHVSIDYIAGTSAGSIAGAFYAAKKNIHEIEEYMLKKSRWEMLSLLTDPSLQGGIFQGKKVQSFLEGYLGKDLTFDDLKIPFHAVAVDLQTGKPISLNKGSVVQAVLASSAIPMVFKPVTIEGRLLVDGGVSSPTPVEEVKKMGAKVVLAINLYEHTHSKTIPANPNLMDVALRSFDIMMRNISEYEVQKADLVVNPHVDQIYWKSLLDEKEKIEGINKGETCMNDQIVALQMLLESKKPLTSWIKHIRSFFGKS